MKITQSRWWCKDMGNLMLWCSRGWINLRFWAHFPFFILFGIISVGLLLMHQSLRLFTAIWVGWCWQQMLGIFSRADLKSTTSSVEVKFHCLHDFSSIMFYIESIHILPCLFGKIALSLLNLLLALYTYSKKRNVASMCITVYCAGIVENPMLNITCVLCRYCREPNAKPLWALSSGCPSNADIPSCSYCRGPLCYEFQVGQISNLWPQSIFHYSSCSLRSET